MDERSSEQAEIEDSFRRCTRLATIADRMVRSRCRILRLDFEDVLAGSPAYALELAAHERHERFLIERSYRNAHV